MQILYIFFIVADVTWGRKEEQEKSSKLQLLSLFHSSLPPYHRIIETYNSLSWKGPQGSPTSNPSAAGRAANLLI